MEMVRLDKKNIKTIEVVAAIISYENKILCVQRDYNKYSYISKKYEFPGGKIESNETHSEALRREIREELEMEISIGDCFLKIEHEYLDFFLIMHSYLCSSSSDKLKLNEHINYKWCSINQMHSLDWAAADIPIVEKLNTVE